MARLADVEAAFDAQPSDTSMAWVRKGHRWDIDIRILIDKCRIPTSRHVDQKRMRWR